MDSIVSDYLRWDPNEETRTEIKSIKDSGDNEKMNSLLGCRLAFGTAGLRGRMGGGYNRMNDLVIIQTTQGLLRYLISQLTEDAKSRGVVIGYDHRRLGSLSSHRFAKYAASVCMHAGFRVFMLENFVATPFVPYAVTFLNCAAGIMVTASHNPKFDNGFKVYWENAAQIIPPHDSGIASEILLNLTPWANYDIETVCSSPLFADVTEAVTNSYFSRITTLSCHFSSGVYTPVVTAPSLKVAYTAMHGVGHMWVLKAFVAFNHPPFFAVPSQAEPDPEFSTVSFPNPEEKGALEESFKFAESQGIGLIVANDPDADRLAVAEKNPETGEWYTFSGNEIGILLGHWCIKKAKGIVGDEKQFAVLASIVSSRMLKAIAEKEGVHYFDTLTGFKWLGNRTLELRAQGMQVLFAYEEALGYCIGDIVCDKDGISAAAVFVELASELQQRGCIGLLTGETKSFSPCTVRDHLQHLYAQYGEFVSFNSYLFCYDPEKTRQIFERLRTGGPDSGYWCECAGAKILAVQDITKGYDSCSKDCVCAIPSTPETEMIMFQFDNGCAGKELDQFLYFKS